MPTNLVKTAADERRWSKAKSIAAQSGRGDNYAYIVGIYKKMTRRNPRPDDTLIFSILNEVKQDLQRAIRIGRDNSQEEALLRYLHAHLPQLMEYIAEQWSIHEGTAGSVSSEPAQVVRPPFEVQARQIDSYDEFDRLYQEAWEMVKKYSGQAGAQTGLERMALLSDLYPEWEDQLMESEGYKAEAMEPSIDFSAVDRGKAPSEPGWEKHFEEGEYLYNFFKEKEIPEITFTKTDSTGTDHMIPNEVVVEHIALTYGKERASIEDTLRKIDYGNGDVNHFLDHLAGAIAEKYVAFAPPAGSLAAVGEPDPTSEGFTVGTVEVTDPKPRAQWINIDWTRDTPHGEWKTNYAWHKREKRWARGKVAPRHVIEEAKRLSEVFANRPPELPKAGTGFGEVGLLSDKYGWVVVADSEDSEWMNILHLVKGENKPREYGYNKAQKRWARRTIPPGDLREEIKKAGWEVK